MRIASSAVSPGSLPRRVTRRKTEACPPSWWTRWQPDRHALLLRVPGHELVEDTSVAVELQGVQRNAAVEGEHQLIGRASGGGVRSVRVLVVVGGQRPWCGQASGPRAV